VTALNEPGDIDRAVEARTDDFLSKPVVRSELKKRVQTLLHVKGLKDENERLRQYIQRMEDQSGPTDDDPESDSDGEDNGSDPADENENDS
jgi:response regulator RpfG family c-di-GMP phosphodiesterase